MSSYVRRIIDMYIDTDIAARQEVTDSGSSTLLSPSTGMFLHRGTQVLFRCRLRQGNNNTAFAVEAGTAWLFGFDSSFTAGHTDLVLSLNAQFNVAGDWSEMDAAAGNICWRADLTTTALAEALGNNESLAVYAYLWMLPPGGSYALLGQWNLTVKNIAVDPTNASASPTLGYVTIDLHNADRTQTMEPTGGRYRLRNGLLQLWNDTQSKWQTVTLTGAAGAETIQFGIGED